MAMRNIMYTLKCYLFFLPNFNEQKYTRPKYVREVLNILTTSFFLLNISEQNKKQEIYTLRHKLGALT